MPGKNKRPQIRPVRASSTYRDVTSNSFSENKTEPVKIKKTRRKLPKKIIIIIALVIVLGAGAIYYFVFTKSDTLPYPIDRQTALTLGYDIYYPNQQKLPTGYILNKNSFYDTDQTLIYTATNGKTKLVFSDQAKPTDAQIQQFYAKNIPLHTTLTTSIGTATIGAIKNQTVVSLPTKSNAWLLITAPGSINQGDLTTIVKSIQLAK